MVIVICIIVLIFIIWAWTSDKADQKEQDNSSGKSRMDQVDENLEYLRKKVEAEKNGTPSRSAATNISIIDPAAKKALIDEAVEVINDMLEVGFIAHCFSDLDYEGHISPIACTISYEPKYNLSGFSIHMRNISDLRTCRNNRPRIDSNPAWAEELRKLDRFIQKYSFCYNPSMNEYNYKTHNNIPVKPSKKQGTTVAVSTAELMREVAARCPKADLQNGLLHTSDVAY